MPRYVHQKNSYSCAPTAIINVAKWANLPITFKHDFNWIKKDIKMSKNGAYLANINKFIRKEYGKYIKIIYKKNPYFLDVKEHIENGGAVLLNYPFKIGKQNNCHIVLITKIIKNKWLVHNIHWKANMFLNTTTIMKYINPSKDLPWRSDVWLLTKKEE